MRLEHVCHAVEKNEWPSPRQMYMSYASTSNVSTTVTTSAAAVSRSPTPSSVTRSSTPHQESLANSLSEQHLKSLAVDSLKHHDLYGLSAMAQLDQYAMVSCCFDEIIYFNTLLANLFQTILSMGPTFHPF